MTGARALAVARAHSAAGDSAPRLAPGANHLAAGSACRHLARS
jgi:hypothetical protein